MATTPQAADVLQSLQGHALLATQVTLKGVGLGGSAQFLHICITEILDPGVGVDARFCEDFLGTGETDAIHVGEGDLNPLFARDIDAGDPSHF